MSETPAKTKTEYVVLRRTKTAVIETNATTSNGREQWDVVGFATAASSEAAVQQHAEKEVHRPTTASPLTGVTATLVAVPSRSWKPVKVSVETVSRVKLEDA